MNNVAISINNISKKYQIGESLQFPTLRDKLVELPNRLFKGPKRTKTFWALRNINISINKGEVVGLVGGNGAGKSTLLKILARITEPTNGSITMYGRVASMLEVGTGFNPELTGRENIYLNGAIIGMSKQEINHKFQDIVDFSGVTSFLDTPVKHYSSGMYVRLAFAVAAHLDADILLIDEVLAVGDRDFQNKCLGKMSSLARSGRTIIYVSHNLDSIRSLCTKAVFLKNGETLAIGEPNKVLNSYTGNARSKSSASFPSNSSKVVYLRKMLIFNNKKKSNNFFVNEDIKISMEIEASKSVNDVEVSIIISNSSGRNILFSSVSDNNESKFYSFKRGKSKAIAIIQKKLLIPDRYYVSFTTHYRGRKQIEMHENILSFDIIESGSYLAPYGPAAKSLATVLGGIIWDIKK